MKAFTKNRWKNEYLEFIFNNYYAFKLIYYATKQRNIDLSCLL